VIDPRVRRIVDQLRTSRFAELGGARVTALIPISERLLNEVIAATLPASVPVREVTVRPQAGNRLAVRARIGRADFLPPVTVSAEIDRQAEFPDSPLVLRVLSLPGLMGLAGAALSMTAILPQGVRMEKDRVFVDLRAMLERAGYGEVVPFLEGVRVTSEEGRLLLDVSLRVSRS
jgi:hypothetical protein